MTPIRVAILGQGRSGRDIHGHALNQMKDMYDIVAVVDDLQERRSRAEQEFGCDSYEHYQQLFERDDIDLVVNALPSFLHVPLSLEFLNKGYNVLCEKPLARKAEDVDSLIEAARQTGTVLSIFQQSRFSPAFVQMKKIIDSGVLGRIVQVSISYSGFSRRWDWQTLKSMNGGNLLNTGPHPVDQGLQLFGTDVMPQVLCRMDQANSYGDAEDYVKLLLLGEGRPTVDIEISSCDAFPTSTYRVQGTLGGLTGNTSRLDWRYFNPDEAPEQELRQAPLQREDGTPAYCGENLIWHEGSWSLPADVQQFPTMAAQFYTMLYRTLANGEPLLVTPQEVRQQIAVMDECFRQNPRFAV